MKADKRQPIPTIDRSVSFFDESQVFDENKWAIVRGESHTDKLRAIVAVIEKTMGPLDGECQPYSDLAAAGAASEIRAILRRREAP